MLNGNAGVQVKHHAEVLKRLMDAFDFARKEDVLVGVPQENSGRSDGITNAELR